MISGQKSETLASVATPEKFPYLYRFLFPITEHYVFMDHASVSPVPAPTRDAMAEMLDGVARHGRLKFPEWEQMVATTRAAAAALMNAKPEQIAFLRNTSEGLSVIANGFPWQKGDKIISTAVEFPANIYPWQRVCEAYGVELKLQQENNGHIDTDELLSQVDDRTRLVTVSWVQFSTGQRLDIRRIGKFCRERGILFVVDAVQGLGALQMDVQRDFVDAVAGSAHKYLLGPKGVGLLYMSDFALELVRPTTIGWTAVNGYNDYRVHPLDFREGARRFEGGTLNEVGICGLGKTLELILKVGPPLIEQHVLSLRDYLSEGLEKRGYCVISPQQPGETSAILVCRHEGHPAEEVCALLDSKQILISARLGGLRISPHFYNTREEADALMDALPT